MGGVPPLRAGDVHPVCLPNFLFSASRDDAQYEAGAQSDLHEEEVYTER